MGPIDYGPGEAKGAPDHPHRGFETVTYMLEGQFGHKDSSGSSGTLNPGDVQWMTAGAGVVHSEMPGDALLRDGGRSHGFQIWVNLPKRDKMIAPRYQEIPRAQIPSAQSDDGTITPILFQHFRLQPGATLVHAVPRSFNLFTYSIAGTGRYGEEGQTVDARHMVMFANDGDAVTVTAGDAPLEFLLLGGVPLNEPVVRYGPFVMNSEEEIRQAVVDYQSGQFGRIAH
jgi:redox-sensitive bicupin YhaK (pirin superfamily)